MYSITFPLCLYFRHTELHSIFIYTELTPKRALVHSLSFAQIAFPSCCPLNSYSPFRLHAVITSPVEVFSDFPKLSDSLLHTLITHLHDIYLISNFTFTYNYLMHVYFLLKTVISIGTLSLPIILSSTVPGTR